MRAEPQKISDSRILHFITIAMVLAGALALSISDADGRYSRTWIAVNFLIETTVAFLGVRYFASLKKRKSAEATVNLILLTVMLASLVWEPI